MVCEFSDVLVPAVNIQLRVFGLEVFSLFASTDDTEQMQVSLVGGDFERLIEPEEEYYEEDRGFGFR